MERLDRFRIALVALSLLAAAITITFLLVRDNDGEGADQTVTSASTLDGTWVDADGNGTIERGPGEPLVDRTDLAPPEEVTAGRTLATLVQITDSHVRDEESPARASLLDRADPDLNSTFRPQESLSPQVLAATVASANEVNPDAVILTGDLIDSSQRNELDELIEVLDGGSVDPDSGGPGYDGPQEGTNPDPFFYRPDVDAPRHPGLLDDAEAAFDSPGLDAPWYPLAGNHDLLAQGEVPPTADLGKLATGDRLLTGLRKSLRIPRSALPDDDAELPDEAGLTPELVDAVIGSGLPGPTRQVPADPRRAYSTPEQTLERLRQASGSGGRAGDPLMDYAFDVGEDVRVIGLDLVNRAGGSGGVVPPGQPAFLRQELARAGDKRVIVMTHQPIDGSAGGERLVALLDRNPNVIATLNGDTHRNSIEPRSTDVGGYWQISTSSLADWPQQSRVLRIVETPGGTAIETWMLDGTGSGLADTARELSYLDAQGGRPQEDAGDPGDRNARLFLP
ncbi:MAG: hypothetical protein ABI553_11270 [Chloroflexota bacterium]